MTNRRTTVIISCPLNRDFGHAPPSMPPTIKEQKETIHFYFAVFEGKYYYVRLINITHALGTRQREWYAG